MEHGRFTLTIRMGNEAMQSPGDVSRALEAVAARLWTDDGFDARYLETSAPIRDDNGNTVGVWRTGVELQRAADELRAANANGGADKAAVRDLLAALESYGLVTRP